MAIEILPQAIALLATLPVAILCGDYRAVLWLSLVQVAAAVATSHAVAERPYRIGRDRAVLDRLLAFGWPIMLSALPLVAVFHGDRMIVGHLFGMEALAGYSVAFLLTMVPGLLAAKVGHALMLTLLAEAAAHHKRFRQRYVAMCEVIVLTSALYLAVFVIAGGSILPLAFGPAYRGLDGLVAWLGLMWSLRMVQAVPGMACMATGETRPLLVAGTLRAAALPLSLGAALSGLGVEGVAAAGVVGEIASLAYVALRLDKSHPGLGGDLIRRTLLLVPVALLAGAVSFLLPAGTDLAPRLAGALLATALIAGAALAILPNLTALLTELRGRTLQPTTAA